MRERRPRYLWLTAALLLVAAGAVLGVAVHAERESTPELRPYDPLHRW